MVGLIPQMEALAMANALLGSLAWDWWRRPSALFWRCGCVFGEHGVCV